MNVAKLIQLREPVLQTMELAGPWGVHVAGCNHPGMYVIHRGAMRFAGTRVNEGDVVLLPAGGPHVMTDIARSAPESLPALEARAERRGDVTYVEGPGPRTIVSAIPFAASAGMPWLPSWLHMRRRDLDPVGRSLLSTYDGALANGDGEVLARVAEALWIKCIAAHIPDVARLDQNVLRAVSQVVEHPAETWTMVSLARFAGLSRSRFSARFTAAMGEPPMHWVQRVKMRHAAALLADGRLGVAAVAEAVGFTDESAFRKSFRRVMGRPASPR